MEVNIYHFLFILSILTIVESKAVNSETSRKGKYHHMYENAYFRGIPVKFRSKEEAPEFDLNLDMRYVPHIDGKPIFIPPVNSNPFETTFHGLRKTPPVHSHSRYQNLNSRRKTPVENAYLEPSIEEVKLPSETFHNKDFDEHPDNQNIYIDELTKDFIKENFHQKPISIKENNEKPTQEIKENYAPEPLSNKNTKHQVKDKISNVEYLKNVEMNNAKDYSNYQIPGVNIEFYKNTFTVKPIEKITKVNKEVPHEIDYEHYQPVSATFKNVINEDYSDGPSVVETKLPMKASKSPNHFKRHSANEDYTVKAVLSKDKYATQDYSYVKYLPSELTNKPDFELKITEKFKHQNAKGHSASKKIKPTKKYASTKGSYDTPEAIQVPAKERQSSIKHSSRSEIKLNGHKKGYNENAYSNVHEVEDISLDKMSNKHEIENSEIEQLTKRKPSKKDKHTAVNHHIETEPIHIIAVNEVSTKPVRIDYIPPILTKPASNWKFDYSMVEEKLLKKNSVEKEYESPVKNVLTKDIPTNEEEYDNPEVVDAFKNKIAVKDDSSEVSHPHKTNVVHEKEYDIPTIGETYKKKIVVDKDGYVIKLDSDTHKKKVHHDEHDSSVVDKILQKKITVDEYDYDSPVVGDPHKVVVDEYDYDSPVVGDPHKVLVDEYEYDSPVVSDPLKEKVVVDYEYDSPVVDPHKKKVVVEYEYDNPAVSDVHKKKTVNDKYDSPVVDPHKKKVEYEYDNPMVSDVHKKKTVNDKYDSSAIGDGLINDYPTDEEYDSPVVLEALVRKNPSDNDYDSDYDQPVVIEALTVKKPVEHMKSVNQKMKHHNINSDHTYKNENIENIKTVVKVPAVDNSKKGDSKDKYDSEKPSLDNYGSKPSVIKKISGNVLSTSDVASDNINNPNEIDTLDNGSGSISERAGNLDEDYRSLLAKSNIWSLMSSFHSQERRKFKKCITPNNEQGNCMPVQMCPVPNLELTLEDLLKKICTIDDIFIGICCPEFPVDTLKVNWENITHTDSSSNSEALKNVDSKVECGKLEGTENGLHSWPWMAPLISVSTRRIFCGGVLIKDQYVLTAAHCTRKIPHNQILVVLGPMSDNHSTKEEFEVIEIKRHAQYNARTMQNDISVLKLSRPVSPGRRICLPAEEETFVDMEAILLGWQGSFAASKNEESLLVISPEECKRNVKMVVSEIIMCTKPRTEDTMCNLDSGAPLIIKKNEQYEVIGVLTWNRNDCDSRFPSVFTRVSHFRRWIENHTS